MSGEIYPDEAERALAEIEHRHGQVVGLLNIPWWYWSAIAVLMVDPVGVLAILGFVAVIVGASLGLAFTLRAVGAAFPGTWGVSVGAALMAGGGPMLNRFLRRRMLLNRAGNR